MLSEERFQPGADDVEGDKWNSITVRHD